MKVIIVTPYNSLNVGSYWQAIALKKFLGEIGHTVYILKRTDGSGSFQSKVQRIIQPLRKLEINTTFKTLKYLIKFTMAQNDFSPVVTMSSTEELSGGIFILGSDEIWNISNKYWREHPVYWGKGLTKYGKVISYAPSVNTATKNDFSIFPEAAEHLKRIDTLSVRDLSTKEIVETFIDKSIRIVCDPTMLYDVKFYHDYEAKYAYPERPFIYIYAFVDIKCIDAVISFARKRKLDIVMHSSTLAPGRNVGTEIQATPLEFLALMHNADYVVTNTFHGTIFSILYRKKFIAEARTLKVKDLLVQFNMQNQLVNQSSDIEYVLENTTYANAEYAISQIRKESREFLTTAISN